MSIQSISGGPPIAPDQVSTDRVRTNRTSQTGAAQDNAFAQQLEKAQQAAEVQADRSTIDKAVDQVKTALAPVARNLQFSIDEDTGKTVVKVVDQSTKEVIRQIPSEELLSITRSLDKFSGLFVKQKA